MRDLGGGMKGLRAGLCGCLASLEVSRFYGGGVDWLVNKER